MRILVVNWQDRLNPQAGGAEVHLHQIFGRLAAGGNEVSLLVSGWPDAPGEEEVDGMRVVRVGDRYSYALRARRAFGRRFTPRAFDILVEDINKLPLFTSFWSDLPVVAIVPHLFGLTAFRQESLPIASTVCLAERLMPSAYRATPIIAISESTEEDLVGRGFDAGRIRVVHPGVDRSVFCVPRDRARHPEPTFAYIGRLKKYKGVDIVIRAVGLLRDRGLRARLLIVGRGDDRRRLESLASRLGLEDRIEFRGYVSESEKVKVLQACWANVYPSPKEGWGMTNVEAAACGTPSVASDSPGLRESVRHGETGYLVRHADESEWAARLELLVRDEKLRDELGRNGVEHAREFSWEAAASATQAILMDAVAR